MRLFRIIALLLPLLAAACGGFGFGGGTDDGFVPDVPTDSPPLVSRVDPNVGARGDTVTIFGLGFTISYPEDIVIIGGAATNGTSYRLLDDPTSSEIEAITAVVPDEAATGEGPIYVQVHGNSSNTDVSFTVLP